jgi:tripartite-type tricarboxylate transporter receptor subunit TctC
MLNRFTRITFAVALLAAVPLSAAAQAFPAKPTRIINPAAARSQD